MLTINDGFRTGMTKDIVRNMFELPENGKVYIVKECVLNVMEKLADMKYSLDVDTETQTEKITEIGTNFDTIINNIYSDMYSIDGIVTDLISKNVLLDTDKLDYNSVRELVDFDINKFSRFFDQSLTDDILKIEYNDVIKLDSRFDYDEVLGTTDDAEKVLHIIFMGDRKKVNSSRREAIILPSYTTIEMRVNGNGGDMEFDHLDMIEYIDSFNCSYNIRGF